MAVTKKDHLLTELGLTEDQLRERASKLGIQLTEDDVREYFERAEGHVHRLRDVGANPYGDPDEEISAAKIRMEAASELHATIGGKKE